MLSVPGAASRQHSAGLSIALACKAAMPCTMLSPGLLTMGPPYLQGIAPLRALAQWTPVQAQATANRVSLVYVAESQEGAAYVTEWDELREAGVSVFYCSSTPDA